MCTSSKPDPVIHIFEPGKVSTVAVESSCVLSATGVELYFERGEHKWGEPAEKSTIYVSTRKDGKWADPVVAPFSGNYKDRDPHLTRDGTTLYFISTRPADTMSSADIWMVLRTNSGPWSEPQRLPHPVNSTYTEYSPRTDRHGNLYFASDRPGGLGQGDLYMSRMQNGELSTPVNIGATINSGTGEWNLEINSSGDILIFEASGRAQNLSPPGDLYISFLKDGTWSSPQNIGEINTTGSDLAPYLTPDERTLYYTSTDSLESTDANIYFIDFEKIRDKYSKVAAGG